MSQLLIPIAFFSFLALFILVFISTARKQRAAKSMAFRKLADKSGLYYEAVDDGSAETFAQDLDGIGRFSSPSLGRMTPKDVVRGTLDGTAVVLFRHATRFNEGDAREWFVAGARASTDVAQRCSVQFVKDGRSAASRHLQDPVVLQKTVGSVRLRVRAASEASAGKFLEDRVLERLAGLAQDLPFRPEVQVRADRVAVYPAERNVTVGTAEDLRGLLEFAVRVAAAF